MKAHPKELLDRAVVADLVAHFEKQAEVMDGKEW